MKKNFLHISSETLINKEGKIIENDFILNRLNAFKESNFLNLFHINRENFFCEKNLENEVLKNIHKNKIDILALEYNEEISDLSRTKSLGLKFLEKIKENFNIKIVIFVPDPSIDIFFHNIKKTDKIIDANVVGGSTLLRVYNFKSVFFTWEIYENFWFENKEKEIDLFYSGQFKPERIKYINEIKKIKNIKKFIQNSSNNDLTKNYKNYHEYANTLLKSKIVVGFSRTVWNLHCWNGRLIQALSSNSLYLEKYNCETPKLFLPYREYVPFFNKYDLIKKIKFYLKNDKIRNTIAKNGQKKIINYYNKENYFSSLFDFIYKNNPNKLYNLNKIHYKFGFLFLYLNIYDNYFRKIYYDIRIILYLINKKKQLLIKWLKKITKVKLIKLFY